MTELESLYSFSEAPRWRFDELEVEQICTVLAKADRVIFPEEADHITYQSGSCSRSP